MRKSLKVFPRWAWRWGGGMGGENMACGTHTHWGVSRPATEEAWRGQSSGGGGSGGQKSPLIYTASGGISLHNRPDSLFHLQECRRLEVVFRRQA